MGQTPFACGARDAAADTPGAPALADGSPRASASCCVSVTKTSSSEGPISRSCACAKSRRGHGRQERLVGPRRVDDRVHGLAEDGRARRRTAAAAASARALRGPRRLDLEASPPGPVERGQRLERVGRAAHDHLRQVEVPDLAAALGLVHVVRRDEEGDALGRELEEEVPQLPARHGVDACGRLVEEDDPRLVHQGAAEREALLPAAAEQTRAPVQVRADVRELDRRVAPAPERSPRRP